MKLTGSGAEAGGHEGFGSLPGKGECQESSKSHVFVGSMGHIYLSGCKVSLSKTM